MKSFTDLSQSKKLAEILPLESADMFWRYNHNIHTYDDVPKILVVNNWDDDYNKDIPCWSLAALLDALPFPQLSKDKLGSGKEGWMVSVYPDNCRYDSCWHDNPVDACIEMIIKLKEQKLL